MPDSMRPSPNYTDLSGEEALRRIRAGEQLRGFAIDELVLSGEFESEIVIRSCLIRKLSVSSARFVERVQIRSCELYRPVFGAGTVFAGGLDLRNSTIHTLNMESVEFEGSVRFDNAELQRHTHIRKCRFRAGIRLWEAHFFQWVEFSGCEFHEKADMRSFVAEEGFELLKCHFHSDVLVRGSSVAKKFNFGESKFEALLDLSKAKLHDYTYLEDISLEENAKLAFFNTIGDRLLIGVEAIEGRLASEEAGDHEQAMAEYAFLKRNFETLNRHEDEDWAYYRFKVNQRRGGDSSWSRPWTKLRSPLSTVFLDWGCGYGVRPFRAVASAAVIILFFGVIYSSGTGMFNVETQPLRDIPADHGLNKALFGVATSVSVFTAGFTGEHLRSAHGWMLVPLAVEALLGTLLWALFIVAFSRKVIR